jgi:hypothetical protein
MTQADSRTAEVHAHWHGMVHPTRMGHLRATRVRSREVFSFEYDGAWLALGQTAALAAC